jgi:hypothetical protein
MYRTLPIEVRTMILSYLNQRGIVKLYQAYDGIFVEELDAFRKLTFDQLGLLSDCFGFSSTNQNNPQYIASFWPILSISHPVDKDRLESLYKLSGLVQKIEFSCHVDIDWRKISRKCIIVIILCDCHERMKWLSCGAQYINEMNFCSLEWDSGSQIYHMEQLKSACLDEFALKSISRLTLDSQLQRLEIIDGSFPLLDALFSRYSFTNVTSLTLVTITEDLAPFLESLITKPILLQSLKLETDIVDGTFIHALCPYLEQRGSALKVLSIYGWSQTSLDSVIKTLNGMKSVLSQLSIQTDTFHEASQVELLEWVSSSHCQLHNLYFMQQKWFPWIGFGINLQRV